MYTNLKQMEVGMRFMLRNDPWSSIRTIQKKTLDGGVVAVNGTCTWWDDVIDWKATNEINIGESLI